MASLSAEMLGFAALGAFALWLRLKFGTNFEQGTEGFVNAFSQDFKGRMIWQLLLFVTLGSLLAVILVEPGTIKQALAAGMAWTSLLGDAAMVGVKKVRSNV
ncbi:MAG TPA: hypothetical protein VIQ05_07395 [Tardiphaga sp.]